METYDDAQYPPENTNALATLRDKIYIHTLPSYANKIFYGLGFLALTCLTLLAVTGFILAFMGQNWWLSTHWGIYTRSVHMWSVQALIFILILHGIVGFSTSGFKKPRRMVWAFGAIMLALIMFQTEFGYGLRGDFSSQYRETSGADFWNGAYLGYWMNPLNHWQEYALHVAIIPIIILVFFIFHFILERTYGIAKPYRQDVPYKLVPANHSILFIRAGFLIAAILALSYVFHSPYVPAVRIADVARQDPSTVSDTLQAEYDRTSDTATYLDSIDPYTFDTRQVFVVMPYEKLTGATEATTSAAMISAIMPAAGSGVYESILNEQDPVPDTYSLRFLADTGAIDDKATALGFDTLQWGMAKDENGHALTFPPGSWWFAPLGVVNTVFNLPENDNGDRIAAELLGLMLLIIITFPYIPYVNRIPEYLHLAPFFWKEPRQ